MLTLSKELIKDGYIKVLQHSLRFPCRKLHAIHNVWLSENSFNTQNSLNITPLKTLLSQSMTSACLYNLFTVSVDQNKRSLLYYP